MVVKKYLLGALMVATVSLVYNYFTFSVLNIYPDLSPDVQFLDNLGVNIYVLIFLKNFLVGLILMVLFRQACLNLEKEQKGQRYVAEAIFYFSLYTIFAMISFSIGDMVLMRSEGGLILLFTVDGIVESFIATIPVRFFYK